jgi:flagellar assembly protein FliH
MSSRILRGNFDAKVSPLGWPSASGASGASGAAAASAVSAVSARRRGGSLQPGVELSVPEQIRQAYAQGLQEGQESEQKQHAIEVRPLIEKLTETLAAFAELRTRIRRESEEELVALSIAIAKRVLHRELTLDPETVKGLVKVAFDRIGSRELNRVRVHPTHSNLVKSFVEQACPNRPVEVVADSAMGPGDVVFETERGDLDASVDSQLEEIRRGLADRLEV